MATRPPLDELYAAPLADFVATRDRLAMELTRDGKKAEGQALKKLRRPSASAWATNQIVREARAAVDGMLDASDRLRRGQDALLAGRSDQTAYQAAVDELRRATAALVQAAHEVLARDAKGARDLVDGVVANVRVAALSAERRRELLEGRLTADLDAGDQGLAGLLSAAGGAVRSAPRGDLKLVPAPEEIRRDKEKREERARRLAAARAEAATARDVAARAETAARAARTARDEAQARLRAAERTLADARETFRAAESELDAAEKHLGRVTSEAKASARRLEALEEPANDRE